MRPDRQCRIEVGHAQMAVDGGCRPDGWLAGCDRKLGSCPDTSDSDASPSVDGRTPGYRACSPAGSGCASASERRQRRATRIPTC
eukprot:1529099-Prymnesium_polylepis.2